MDKLKIEEANKSKILRNILVFIIIYVNIFHTFNVK